MEEDSIAARQLEQTLAELGHRVLTASTGGHALAIARQRGDDVDLLITDVAMQGMNGLELARELRKVKEGLAVLFVSGDTSGVLADRGILGHEVEFLTKPVPPETLALRVGELLSRSYRTNA